jgi:hypothetical protein
MFNSGILVLFDITRALVFFRVKIYKNVLRKLKFTLSKQALSNIYLTFIRPVLEYALRSVGWVL